MKLSPRARDLLAPLVAAVTVWAIALVGLGADKRTMSDEPRAHTPVAAAPAPRGPAPPVRLGPLEIHFTTKGETSVFRTPTAPVHPRRFAAIRQTDGKTRETSSWPGVRFDQYSSDGEFIVYQKIVGSSFREYSGCGVAGCSHGYYSSAQAGIVLRRRGDARGTFLSRAGYDSAPRLSPDGGTIAYLQHIADPKGSNGQADVVAFMTTSGQDVGALPRKLGSSDSSVAWSPDGRRVAIVRSRYGEYNNPSVEIWTADGRFVRRVGRGDFRELVWSHDGTRLAAIRQMTERDDPNDRGLQTGQEVYVLPVDGGPPKRLTHFSPIPPRVEYAHYCGRTITDYLYAKTPMWSPDDTKIAFLTNHLHTRSGSEAFDVAVTAADGSKLRIVRSTPRTTCKGPLGGHYDLYTEKVELLGWRHTKAPVRLDRPASA